MNSLSGYELGFGSGLNAMGANPRLTGLIHLERRVRSRRLARPGGSLDGPPWLAAWAASAGFRPMAIFQG
jgi:hypothetical protein